MLCSCGSQTCRPTENDNEEDDDDTTDPKGKDITINQAKDSISTLIAYFEQTSAILTSDDIKRNSAALDNLWPLSMLIADKAAKESRQTKVTDFFKKLT